MGYSASSCRFCHSVIYYFFERGDGFARGHTFGLQRENLVAHLRNTRLVFLNQLGFKGFFTIARRAQLNFAVIAKQLFWRAAIAGIRAFFEAFFSCPGWSVNSTLSAVSTVSFVSIRENGLRSASFLRPLASSAASI